MQGPNVKKLIVWKMAHDMVPEGAGFFDVMLRLTAPGNIGKRARAATAWIAKAIDVVKTAPDNPYGDDDEAIAGEILRQIGIKDKKMGALLASGKL